MQKNSVFFLQSFLAITLVFYLPGLMVREFFVENFNNQYNYKGEPYSAFLIMFATYTVCFVFIYSFFSRFNFRPKLLLPTTLISFGFYSLIILYLFCSVYFFLNYDASFRHTSRLADAGIFVKLLFFIQPLIYIYIMFAVIHLLNGNSLGRTTKVMISLFLVGMLLSLNSSLQLISIAVIFAVLVKPDLFRQSLLNVSLISSIMIAFSCFVGVLGVLIVGLGNKLGFDFLFSSEGLDFAITSIGNIFARISSSLMSNATLFDVSALSADISFASLESINATFLNRFALVFPFSDSFNSQLIDTVSRTNFVLVFKDQISRAGASPGVLASIFYVPIYPAGFLLLPLFYTFLIKSISCKLSANCRYNLIAMLAVPFFILPFFEAPLNILYVIDPVFISLIVFLLFRYVNIGKLYNY